jgi:dTDP-glucose 4,6-dehydratase
MRTILVTGGAGFIGSAFVRLVLEEFPGYLVLNYDSLTYAGNLENLAGLDEGRHSFIRGDICDPAAVEAAIPEGCDAVINFAAETHVDRSITSANEFLTTNVLGTQVLIDAARRKGVGRFVQVSTDEVMGSLPDDGEEVFTEDSPLRPNSPYAASKAAAELLVRAARETHGVDTVITRCGNNYGPRQFPEKLIPLMIANALANEPLPVYGDGQHVRDWIHVEDHCRAVWLAFERGSGGEIYNIGARNERQNIEVVHLLLEMLGKPASLIRFVEDRPGHDRRYAIDPSKAERELGWRPAIDWETGMRRTVDWYLNNRAWVDHIRSGEYRDYYRSMYAKRLADGEGM